MDTLPQDPDFLSDLIPYRCPKCGDLKRFATLRELKLHLESDHSYRIGYIKPRKRVKVFGQHERRDERRYPDTQIVPEKEQKDRASVDESGRVSPLLQSYKDDARLLELELELAKQAEMKNKIQILSGHIKADKDDYETKASLDVGTPAKSAHMVYNGLNPQERNRDTILDSTFNGLNTLGSNKGTTLEPINGYSLPNTFRSTVGLKSGSGFGGTLNSLNRTITSSRQIQWNTEDALYQAHNVIQGMEDAADQRCQEQRNVIKELVSGMKAKEQELMHASKELDNLKSQRQSLFNETDELLRRTDENNGKLKQDMLRRENELAALNSELEKMRLSSAKDIEFKDRELELSKKRMEKLEWERDNLIAETDQLLQRADADSGMLRSALQSKEDQLRKVNREVDRLRAEQQALLEQSVDLYKKAEEGTANLKGLLKSRDTQLQQALMELEKMQLVQNRLIEQSQQLTKQADENNETMKRLLVNKEGQLLEASRELEQLKTEKTKLEDNTMSLAQKAENSVFVIESLQDKVNKKEERLKRAKQELDSMKNFLKDTAQKETVARGKLEVFIGELIDRADKAENELKAIKSTSSSSPEGRRDVVDNSTSLEEEFPVLYEQRQHKPLERIGNSHTSQQNIRHRVQPRTQDQQFAQTKHQNNLQQRLKEKHEQQQQQQPNHIPFSHPKRRRNVAAQTTVSRSVAASGSGPERTSTNATTHEDNRRDLGQGRGKKYPLAKQIIDLGADSWQEDVLPVEETYESSQNVDTYSHPEMQGWEPSQFENYYKTIHAPSHIPSNKSYQQDNRHFIPKNQVRARKMTQKHPAKVPFAQQYMDSTQSDPYGDSQSELVFSEGMANAPPHHLDYYVEHQRRPVDSEQDVEGQIRRARRDFYYNSGQSRDIHGQQIGRASSTDDLSRSKPYDVQIQSRSKERRIRHNKEPLIPSQTFSDNPETGIDNRRQPNAAYTEDSGVRAPVHAYSSPKLTSMYYIQDKDAKSLNDLPLAYSMHHYQPDSRSTNTVGSNELLPHSLMTSHPGKWTYPVKHSMAPPGRHVIGKAQDVYSSTPDLLSHSHVLHESTNSMNRNPFASSGMFESPRRCRSQSPRYRLFQEYHQELADPEDDLNTSSREKYPQKPIRRRLQSAAQYDKNKMINSSQYEPDPYNYDRNEGSEDEVNSDEDDFRIKRNFDEIMDNNGIMWEDMDTLPDISDSELDRVSPSGSEAAGTSRVNSPPSAGRMTSLSTRPSYQREHERRGKKQKGSIPSKRTVQENQPSSKYHIDLKQKLAERNRNSPKESSKSEQSNYTNSKSKDEDKLVRRIKQNWERPASRSEISAPRSKGQYKYKLQELRHKYLHSPQSESSKNSSKLNELRSKYLNSPTTRSDKSAKAKGFHPIVPSDHSRSSSHRDMTSGAREIHSFMHAPLSSETSPDVSLRSHEVPETGRFTPQSQGQEIPKTNQLSYAESREGSRGNVVKSIGSSRNDNVGSGASNAQMLSNSGENSVYNEHISRNVHSEPPPTREGSVAYKNDIRSVESRNSHRLSAKSGRKSWDDENRLSQPSINDTVAHSVQSTRDVKSRNSETQVSPIEVHSDRSMHGTPGTDLRSNKSTSPMVTSDVYRNEPRSDTMKARHSYLQSQSGEALDVNSGEPRSVKHNVEGYSSDFNDTSIEECLQSESEKQQSSKSAISDKKPVIVSNGKCPSPSVASPSQNTTAGSIAKSSISPSNTILQAPFQKEIHLREDSENDSHDELPAPEKKVERWMQGINQHVSPLDVPTSESRNVNISYQTITTEAEVHAVPNGNAVVASNSVHAPGISTNENTDIAKVNLSHSPHNQSVHETVSKFAEPLSDTSLDGDVNNLNKSIDTDTDIETDLEELKKTLSSSLHSDRGDFTNAHRLKSSSRQGMSSASSQASMDLIDRLPLAKREEVRRRRQALLHIFSFLDTNTLGRVSEVCREWKLVSRNSGLWKRVELKNDRISSKYLSTISRWCKQLKHLILEDLKPRNRRRNESVEDYVDSTRACLEQGLEQLLKRSEASLVSLSIINCGHQLTSKSLWAASCYSRMLLHVTYMSDVDPIGPEVMWALGSGCRDLKTLIVPPLYPCQKPGVFNTKCVNLIGRCFQDLEVLCIGGLDVETSSLIVIGKCCQRLQSLEMNHMKEVTTETAKGMCDVGLKMLKILDFVHTPIDPGVVNIFYDTCKHLKRIKIQMGLKDFANGRECKVDVEEYETAVEKLADLKIKPGLGNILRFKAQPGVKLVN